MSDSEENFNGAESGSDGSDFEVIEKENIKPKKTVSKTASTKTATKSKKKEEKEEDDDDDDSQQEKPKSRGPKKKPQASDYQKLDQIEHALKRPDMYIGNATKIKSKLWVWEEGMKFRDIEYVPGLYKIFDEILVNAADNKQRDPDMDYIKVEILPEEGMISVQNDGEGIPVEMHPKEKMYVPTMIFGHLLTGSNFDDTIKKVTGGRNGLGAKLANIFSKEFIVETVDPNVGKSFKQVWRDNMSDISDPVIKSSKVKSYTKISFKPDLTRFGMTVLDDDILALMRKRVYDLAGCNPALKIYLNGQRINIKNFKQYCELYLNDDTKPKIHERVSDRWEVCVSLSDGEFQQVSFVNSICTTRGGTHVQHVLKKLTKTLQDTVQKKNKAGAAVTPAQIKNHLWVFVNCLIENPGFDSQTKETLTTPTKDFGSKCELSEPFLKKVVKSGVVDNILLFAKARHDVLLKKQTGGVKKKQRLTGIAKLDDANNAGGRNAENCTLILTEGDSAKTLAVAGLSVVGRDNYGVFPLRGKLLNVREAASTKLLKNEEITNLIKIIGLQLKKEYESVKSLRYGHIMIMTDQDTDGSHIKGLIINFLHYYWPQLLKVPGFVTEFITPIVKARRGKQEISFYTIPEYQNFKNQVEEKGERWEYKYYKGLGTSTNSEAKEYFADIENHQIHFAWSGEEDGKFIEMAFAKGKADDRKEWMRQFKPGTYLDQSVQEVSYSDFINKELILFSLEDCIRSVPSLVDGLKPGQRKILFACFKRKKMGEIKVAQLAGAVAECSAYHHGEQSLQQTIVNMAQNFVGSNNLNLLLPNGQFGTRLQGGKDAASARYIFTQLNRLTRTIFHPDDDALLDYLDDEGLSIEPSWYIPILPMILVNGAEGIGTGWSTSIPNYNPKDIIINLKHLMNDEELEPMHPWYRGFKGNIEWSDKKKSYKVDGIWNKVDDNTIEVTELPIGQWTQSYKEFLESLVEGTDKQKPIVKDYKEYHTDASVHFRIEFLEGKLQELEASGKFESKMKLSSSISVTNLVLFDHEARIQKYATVHDILKEFYLLRLKYYEKRKEYLIDQLNMAWSKLDNKVRFILAVIKDEINIRNRKRVDLLAELKSKKYTPFPPASSKKRDSNSDDSGSEKDEKGDKDDDKRAYDYLLSMPLWNLTWEKVQKLMKEREEKEKELAELTQTPVKDLWLRDLDNFTTSFEEWCIQEEEIAQQKPTRGKGKSKSKRKGASSAARKRKPLSDDEEEDDFMPKEKPKQQRKLTLGTATKALATKAEPKDEKPKETIATLKKDTPPVARKESTPPTLKKETTPPTQKKETATQKKETTTAKGKKLTNPTIQSFFKTAPSKALDNESDEEDEIINLTAGIKKGNTSTKMDIDKAVVNLSDSEEEKEKKPTKKAVSAPTKATKTTAKKPATTAKGKGKGKKKEESESEPEQEESADESEEENSFEVGDDSDDNETAPPVKSTKAAATRISSRRAATSSSKKYAESSEEEEEDDSEKDDMYDKEDDD